MTDRASLTAEYMALFRALESTRPESCRLFSDPFAPIFLRHWRRCLLRIARLDAGRRLVEHLLDRNAPGARAAGIARTKWIDDQATSALETIPQLVLLGAGFDTRAYRLASAQSSITFELDHPQTSLAKQAALNKALGPLTEKVRFAAIDFNCQSLIEVLRQAGFDPLRTACFIWEGVTNYLSAEAVDAVLRQIRQAATGSVLLFTYIHRAVLEQPQQFFGAEKLMRRLQSYGEPWTFGLLPEELDAYLSARGLRLMKDASVAEVWQGAGRCGSDIHGYEFYRLACARVER